MKTRFEIAEELLNGCPAETEKDHEAIARAIVSGVSCNKILEMPEVNRWPQTYLWLRDQFEELVTIHADNGISIGRTFTGYAVAQTGENTRVRALHPPLELPVNLGLNLQMPRKYYALSVSEEKAAFERDFLFLYRLGEMLEKAREYLDPMQVGINWPDPVAWDGRPLWEQARDVLVLLEVQAARESEDGVREYGILYAEKIRSWLETFDCAQSAQGLDNA